MKCPLMSQPYESGEYQSKWHGVDCLKEECAWWNEHYGMCSQAVAAYHEGVLDRARERDIAIKGG